MLMVFKLDTETGRIDVNDHLVTTDLSPCEDKIELYQK